MANLEHARRWRRLDIPALEEFTEDGLTFRGRVRVDEPVPWTAEYRVDFEPTWATLRAEARVERAGTVRHCVLHREPDGRWIGPAGEIEACRGALDVDLGVTPSTNTSAIRRLALPVGGTAELTATWVRFPDLTVEPLRQRYTRLADRTYLYESLRDGVVAFRARLEVDGEGRVERYEGIFERIA